MYRLSVSELAHDDLGSVVSYIAERLAAPKAASDLLGEVELCYNRLEENPFVYERCRDPILAKEGYRRAIIKNYILTYKIDEITKTVNIHRFFHGSQNYMNLI